MSDEKRRLSDGAQDELGQALLDVAQAWGPAVEIFAFTHAEGAAPQMLASAGCRGGRRERVSVYLNRYWQRDPMLHQAGALAPGAMLRRRVAASEIDHADYRATCFCRPGFAEKLSMAWRTPERLFVLSIYLSAAESVASTRFDPLLRLARPALLDAQKRSTAGPLVPRLEARLAAAYPSLSRREIQICARTLAGLSSKEIGRELGIGPASVMTYRQRAYARYCVSEVGQLLDRIVEA